MAPALVSQDRAAWRAIVAEIAEKAKATLPECNGRVDKAVALVLAGGVELLPDGTARVESCSDPLKTYTVNGTCECHDYERAPSHWCKHRIAAGIQKRVDARMPPAEIPGNSHTPLPEARSSLNFKALVQGFEVQITMRDETEEALLGRLQVLLKNQSIRPIPKPAPRTGNWKGGARRP
jgi:hypothetical protein